MKYNPIGTVFKEGNVLLLVEEGVQDGSSCARCYYNAKDKKGSKIHGTSCFFHGHACTPINRKDKKHVIFRKIQVV